MAYGKKTTTKKKPKGRVTETVKKVAKKGSFARAARAGIPGASMIAQGLKAQSKVKKQGKK